MNRPDVFDDAVEFPKDLAIPADAVRMRFTGSTRGLVTTAGTRGRSYRGSALPAHQFALVHPDDVALLLRGGWQLAAEPGKS